MKEKIDQILTKINSKLGGKVDVKSKKVQLIAGCVMLVIAIITVGYIIYSGGDSAVEASESVPNPVYNTRWAGQLEFLNALNDAQRREYFLIQDFCIDNDLMDVISNSSIPRDGKTYSELIQAWREKLGEENCAKLDEYIQNAPADAHKAPEEAYIKMLEHYVWVQEEGKTVLSEKYGVECIEVYVGGWNTGDTRDTVWLDAVAVFRDDSGEEVRMSFEVTSGLDRKLLLFTAKE